jgi:hypothetical protein
MESVSVVDSVVTSESRDLEEENGNSVTRGDKAPNGRQIRLTGAIFCHFNTKKRTKISQFLDLL